MLWNLKVTYIHPKQEQIQELSPIQLTILVRMIGFNLVERVLFEKLKIGKLCLFSGKPMSDLLYPTAKSLKQSQRVILSILKIPWSSTDASVGTDIGWAQVWQWIRFPTRYPLVSYSRTFRTQSIRAQIQIYPVYIGLCPTHRSIRTRLNIHKVTIKSQEISWKTKA